MSLSLDGCLRGLGRPGNYTLVMLLSVTRLILSQIWMMPGSNVCRGVIASPTKVQAFELPFDHTSPITRHSTDECGTTYPTEEDMLHIENPITGLFSLHVVVYFTILS